MSYVYVFFNGIHAFCQYLKQCMVAVLMKIKLKAVKGRRAGDIALVSNTLTLETRLGSDEVFADKVEEVEPKGLTSEQDDCCEDDSDDNSKVLCEQDETDGQEACSQSSIHTDEEEESGCQDLNVEEESPRATGSDDGMEFQYKGQGSRTYSTLVNTDSAHSTKTEMVLTSVATDPSFSCSADEDLPSFLQSSDERVQLAYLIDQIKDSVCPEECLQNINCAHSQSRGSSLAALSSESTLAFKKNSSISLLFIPFSYLGKAKEYVINALTQPIAKQLGFSSSLNYEVNGKQFDSYDSLGDVDQPCCSHQSTSPARHGKENYIIPNQSTSSDSESDDEVDLPTLSRPSIESGNESAASVSTLERKASAKRDELVKEENEKSSADETQIETLTDSLTRRCRQLQDSKFPRSRSRRSKTRRSHESSSCERISGSESEHESDYSFSNLRTAHTSLSPSFHSTHNSDHSLLLNASERCSLDWLGEQVSDTSISAPHLCETAPNGDRDFVEYLSSALLRGAWYELL